MPKAVEILATEDLGPTARRRARGGRARSCGRGIFLVVVVVGAMIGLGSWSWKKEKQRRLDRRAARGHNGLRFTETRDGSMDDRYPVFTCLRQGSNRYAYNVMHGRAEGRDACCFDYHYETYSTDSKGQRQTHHHHFSAVVLEHGSR